MADFSAEMDVAIIGAGVVGCAMARRFALEGARVCVLEAAPDILSGASKANSAILHTGFDAPPGSLELSCMQDAYDEYMEIREAMNLPVLETGAMVAAWSDEDHVIENRALYRRKFERVLPILAEVSRVERPRAGFYLWPELDIDDLTACERLLGEAGVLTLPGSFLGRATATGNPGANRLRIALVANLQDCEEAALRMRENLGNL